MLERKAATPKTMIANTSAAAVVGQEQPGTNANVGSQELRKIVL